MKSILILTATLCILSSTTVAGDSESTAASGTGEVLSSEIEWQIITKQNFSSQIRLHPHLLLLITVPWSGEARSIMKELAQAVSMKHEKFDSLQLRVMYKSNERMLADTLGANEGLNFLYYHHSLSYRFQGRIRAQNVLSSIYSVMSLLPEEQPLKPLDTPEVLKAFVESPDKSVILMEFCGWTSRLLAEKKNNLTENIYGTEGGAFDTNLDGETTKPMYMESKDHKDSPKRLSCAVKDKETDLSFTGELYSVNKSATLETESMMPGFGLSCTYEEFQLYESFFTQFISVTREFFLPPERQRYGLVTDKSLLSFLDVEDPGPWLGMIKVAGCSGCASFFKEVDELKFGLQTHNAFIPELEDDGHDTEPALPENKPSILLFVDRSSESSVTREKSVDALVSFRQLAYKYQAPHQVDWKKNDPRPRAQAAARSTNLHSELEQSPIRSIANLKEKIKFLIVNDGKQVTLDDIASNFQGNNLNDIMAYFRQIKKESTLSSLAKELGFQLLSDDHDIKIEDTIPSEPFQSYRLPSGLPLEGKMQNHDGLATGQHNTETISIVGHVEVTKTVDGDPSSHCNMEKPTHSGAESQTTADRHDISPVIGEITNEDKNHVFVEKRQEELDAEGFNGSFFFSDGGYQLLRALTGNVNIPSMVIFDPLSMQHFVYPEDGAFTNSSLFDFLHQYINRTLIPYQRSESTLSSSKEDFCTPFVNHDFSEVDSVPPVTAISLNKFIPSLIQSGNHSSAHGCKEDVLVLFSNRWCGFCQRMELIVREVFRALKGYKTQKDEKNASLKFGSDSLMDNTMQFPLIYLMDCTLNECSSILKSMGQSEVYPALTLFPAEKKNAVSYEGDMAVTDVIKFIANHGSHSHHLITEKGILLSEVEDGGKKQNLFKDISTSTANNEDSVAVDNAHEVLLKNWLPKRPMQYNQIRSQSSNDKGHIIAGSVLIATEKLINVPTFQNSMNLIIQADRTTGFLGVIINKLISWDSLQNLEHTMSLDLEQLQRLQEAPLSFGGPVITREVPLIALSRKFIKQEYPEILPGVYFLEQGATRKEIEGPGFGNVSLTDYWFFLGYSSWSWDQLHDEIDDGAWNLTDRDLVQLDWPH